MSSEATSSPVSASTLAYLMRWPVLRLIWLKLTFSVSDVAGYRATGQVTSERRKKPFQLARGAMGYSENATDNRPRIPPGHPVSSEPGGESPNGVNRGGAGWLQDGSRSGAGKARFTHRAMDGIGRFRNFRPCRTFIRRRLFFAPEAISFAGPTTTRRLYQFALPSGF